MNVKAQENYIKCTAIVLKTTLLKERSCVTTLFTKELGKISCFAHGIGGKNLIKRQLTTPLSYGIFFLKKRKGSYILHEGQSTQLMPKETFEKLQLAATLVHTIQTTQMEEKAAPHLFELLLLYLQKCHTHENTAALHGSFLVKLLVHEGMYHGKELLPGLSRSENETLQKLAAIRHFTAVENVVVEKSTLEKLQNLLTFVR